MYFFGQIVLPLNTVRLRVLSTNFMTMTWQNFKQEKEAAALYFLLASTYYVQK